MPTLRPPAVFGGHWSAGPRDGFSNWRGDDVDHKLLWIRDVISVGEDGVSVWTGALAAAAMTARWLCGGRQVAIPLDVTVLSSLPSSNRIVLHTSASHATVVAPRMLRLQLPVSAHISAVGDGWCVTCDKEVGRLDVRTPSLDPDEFLQLGRGSDLGVSDPRDPPDHGIRIVQLEVHDFDDVCVPPSAWLMSYKGLPMFELL